MGENAFNLPLTDKQLEVVNYEGEEILIKGIAGSGKTTVLLRRAVKLIRENPNLKIAIFTYNRTLANYAKHIVEEFGLDNLTVHTFHSWASSVLYSIRRKRTWTFKPSEKKQILQDVIRRLEDSIEHRFIKEEKYQDFLLDEFSWIKGKVLKTEKDYLKASRKGRGSEVRVTSKDRKVLYQIFEAFEAEKAKSWKIDWDDFGPIIYENKDKINDRFTYNHVMVDEAQDLRQVELMILRFIAQEAFVVAADKGQKIYKTSFSWKDIGINILGGRTKILKNSYRSTKEIIQMAHSLQLNDPVVKDEEYVEPSLPEYSGEMPVVFECKDKKAHDLHVLETIKMILEKDKEASVAILSRKWKTIERLKRAFNVEGINYEEIKKDNGNALSKGLKLTTFHSAKGLEFDYVIIVDLVEEELEFNEDFEEEEYLEVERRLLYVSITRARKHVQIFYYSRPMKLLNEIDSSLYKKYKI